MRIRDFIVYGILQPYGRVLACAIFLVGMLWVSVFHVFDRRTEIEEHGLAVNDMNSQLATEAYKSWTRTAYSEGEGGSEISRVGVDEAEVKSKLWEVLEASVEFRNEYAKHGRVIFDDDEKTVLGFSTIAHTRRGDSRESLILVFEYDPAQDFQQPGVYIHGLLDHFGNKIDWLSRDIIFLLVDKTVPYAKATRKFLRDYYDGKAEMKRSGIIRQGIVVDFNQVALSFDDLDEEEGTSSSTMPAIGGQTPVLVDIEGVNGFLPNQDVVNALILNTLSALSLRPIWDTLWYTGWQNGGVHGAHSALLEYQIPSFTLRRYTDLLEDQHAMWRMMTTIEFTLRNFSNLTQQLHHSFNTYLFTSPRSHVSSGIYYYSVFAIQSGLISFFIVLPPKGLNPFRDDFRGVLVGFLACMLVVIFTGLPLLFYGYYLTGERSEDDGGAGVEKHFFASERYWILRKFPWAHVKDLYFDSPSSPDSAMSYFMREHTLFCSFYIVSISILILLLKKMQNFLGSFRRDVKFFYPLWYCMQCACAFLSFAVLVNITILNFGLGLWLTLFVVTTFIFAAPVSVSKQRGFTNILFMALFLSVNLYFLFVPQEQRRELVGKPLSEATIEFWSSTQNIWKKSLVIKKTNFAPEMLVMFICQWLPVFSQFNVVDYISTISADFYHVGAMAFPVLCLFYVPMCFIFLLITFLLNGKSKRDYEARGSQVSFTTRDVKVCIVALTVFGGGAMGAGLYWKNLSSAGFKGFKNL